MTDTQTALVTRFYSKIRDNLDHGQVNMLTSMLINLGRQWEEVEKIEEINVELDTQNKKCGWKKDFTPIQLLPVPKIRQEAATSSTEKGGN